MLVSSSANTKMKSMDFANVSVLLAMVWFRCGHVTSTWQPRGSSLGIISWQFNEEEANFPEPHARISKDRACTWSHPRLLVLCSWPLLACFLLCSGVGILQELPSGVAHCRTNAGLVLAVLSCSLVAAGWLFPKAGAASQATKPLGPLLFWA